MKEQSQFIVIYKDSATARNQYYGPFVSDRMASDFMDTLPEPLNGGLKTYKSMSPYTYDEADLARDVVLRQRSGKSEVDKVIYHRSNHTH